MPFTTVPSFVAGNVLTAAQQNVLGADLTFLANPPKVRVFNSAAISVANGTPTALTFDSERFDTDTGHSTSVNTSRITFTTAGTYMVGGSLQWGANTVGYRYVGVRSNGSTLIAVLSVPVRADGFCDLAISTLYAFSAGDYIELVAQQSSGGALNVPASPATSPEFWAVWLSL